MTRPKLKLLVGQAAHFLRWELPYVEKNFETVDEPSENTVLYAFGPDVLKTASEMPALRRVAMLFPGFAINPYHNLGHRQEALELIESCYDLVFVNPGPLSEAYKSSAKVVECSLSIDTRMFTYKKPRKVVNSLLHASADYPHKDWQRSVAVMEATGLQHEVFPPRLQQRSITEKVKHRLNHYSRRLRFPEPFKFMPAGYMSHQTLMKKYQRYDGFVHVAGEIPHPLCIDGKYTACLMEAGATGAILFWHDTLKLGNDLETVFNLPLEPTEAAREILQIRKSINVEQHSRRTREEILDVSDPERSVNFRSSKIKELL